MIKFKDLSWVLKVGAITGCFNAIIYIYYFLVGFISAL